jgi:hypothetical protein
VVFSFASRNEKLVLRAEIATVLIKKPLSGLPRNNGSADVRHRKAQTSGVFKTPDVCCFQLYMPIFSDEAVS